MAKATVTARVDPEVREYFRLGAVLTGTSVSIEAGKVLDNLATKFPHEEEMLARFRALEAEHGEGKVTPVMLLVQS